MTIVKLKDQKFKRMKCDWNGIIFFFLKLCKKKMIEQHTTVLISLRKEGVNNSPNRTKIVSINLISVFWFKLFE